ncbi:hypothetical protein [Haladaptatus sp. DYF46]|uniref:DUF7096 domain-containing protein n=1 Tax=Haladaptatus sp. DYF46 TaxID=2886041 RepID=UPI001E307F5C|nr:hypothetical protein [Haladaptatus sp. DYF46]
MNSARAVLLIALLLSGFALAVPTAAAPTPDTTPDAQTDVGATSFQANQQTNNTTNNSTLGAEISSFMQVSTSQAKGTVDTGMWVARFNQTKNKSARQALVSNNVGDMKNQLADLQERKQKLVQARNSGRISRLKYQSEMSQLIGEIRAIQYSISATRPRAVTVGTRVGDVDNLSERADTAGGPEMIEVARSIHSVHLNGEENNSTMGPGGNETTNESGENPGTSIGSGTVGVGNDSSDGTASGGSGNGNGSVDAGVGVGNETVSVGIGS